MRMSLKSEFPAEWLSPKKVRATALNSITWYCRRVIKDLYKTTKTWEAHDAIFYFDVKYAHGNAEGYIWTDSDVWNWLDQGTDVKWVYTSDDFEPKTQYRDFNSYPGAGEIIFSDTPTDGIIAREWTQEIMERDQEGFDTFVRSMAEVAFWQANK